jgi:hypothetical protein
MRIVYSEHPPAVRPMQSQRIGEPVGPFPVRRDALRNELDPIPSTDFRQESVQVEQPLQALVRHV